MTTLQLNQKLLGELTAIVGDEDKMRQAIRVLHIIATNPAKSSKKHFAAQKETEEVMDDKQWNKYFADKPAIDLPTDTNTEQFVNSAKRRVSKQVKQWQ